MKSIFGLLILGLAVSCATNSSKEKASTFNSKVEQEKIKTQKDLGPSADKRLPLQAGQWVKIHTIMKGENPEQFLATFKVIKVAGHTVTMEVETTNTITLDLQIMQYEVENYPDISLNMTKDQLAKKVDNMKIKKIIMKQGYAPAQEIAKAYMPMAKGMVKQLFSSGYRIGDTKPEACSSDSYKSSRCLVFEYEATADDVTSKGTTYTHSAVPVLGFIKSVSDKSDTQVINFGTGAKSSL